MSSIKVMLVDDHEVVRLGLRAALDLEDDIEIVGDFGDGPAALRDAPHSHPDVVLMDVRMPGMSGIEVCRALRDLVPETRVLMLTSFADEQAVFASITAGAAGYLLKNAARGALVDAVRSAAGGESLLDPAVTARVMARLKDLTEKEEDREVASLSDREREVLALVARGLTNRQIAADLVISEHTARNHISRILDKLGLSRRSEAATFAAQHGLVGEERRGDDQG